MSTEKDDVLVKYVGDQLAAEKHVLEVVEGQLQDKDLVRYPHVVETLTEIRAILSNQVSVLASHLQEDLGETNSIVGSSVKEAMTTMTSALATIYGKVRTEKVSKMLRDDYAALSMGSLAYTMLHATALALGNETTAGIAVKHLKEMTPLVVELNDIIPSVVVEELRERGLEVRLDADDEALKRSHEAWSSMNISKHTHRTGPLM